MNTKIISKSALWNILKVVCCCFIMIGLKMADSFYVISAKAELVYAIQKSAESSKPTSSFCTTMTQNESIIKENKAAFDMVRASKKCFDEANKASGNSALLSSAASAIAL